MRTFLRSALCGAFLLLGTLCSATAYNTSASGNWNVAGTWTTGVCGTSTAPAVPVAGDTVTVCTAHVVTVPAAYTATVGTSGATGTVAVTLAGTGTLTVAAAGILNLRGDLSHERGTTININGTLNFNPPDGSTYKFNYATTGSGESNLNLVGTSGAHAIVTTVKQGTTGGNGWFTHGGRTPMMNFQYVEITNCGDSSNNCTNYNTATNSSGLTQNIGPVVLFDTAGTIVIYSGTANAVMTIDGMSVTRCAKASCTDIENTVDKTTGSRYIRNTTFSNTSSKSASFVMRDVVIGVDDGAGTCTTPGIQSFNTQVLLTSSHRATLSCSLGVATTAFSNGTVQYLIPSNGTSIVSNNIAYFDYVNPHPFNETTSLALASNTYRFNVCDGNGAVGGGDANGDCFGGSVGGTRTITRNLVINKGGTLLTALSTVESDTVTRNTVYGASPAAVGETSGSATQIPVFRNNLMVLPVATNGNGGFYQSGSPAWLRQTSLSLDYNAYRCMPGSGESCHGNSAVAASDPVMIPNPNDSNAVSYVGFPTDQSTSTGAQASTASTTTLTTFCSTCNFTTTGATIGDRIFNRTRNQYATISNVNSSTQVTHGAIASQVAGDTFEIISTRPMTASTTTTQVNCSTCHFTSSGTIAGDYVLNTSRSNAYARISSVDSDTQLTLATAIASQASGDNFQLRTSYWATAGQKYGDDDRGLHDIHITSATIFRDPTRTTATWDTSLGGAGTIANVAAEIVKVNGYSATGAAATYNSNYTAANLLAYLRYGFTPTLSTLKGTGSPADGSLDIGAMDVVLGGVQGIGKCRLNNPGTNCI